MFLSSPTPVPSAVISVVSSCDDSMRSKRTFSTFKILPRSGRIAWNCRLRPCLAEPPALSPSTMKISLLIGSRSWQSASLPGSEVSSSAPLRCTISRALRAASRARDATTALLMMLRASLGWRSRYWPSLSATTSGDRGGDLRRDQLVLGLVRVLGIADLDRDHSRQALAQILAGQPALGLLEQLGFVRVVVDRPGQRLAKPREVGAAVAVLDRVGEAADDLGVTVVPLHRDLDRALGGPRRCLRRRPCRRTR